MSSSKKIYLLDLDGTLLNAHPLFFIANIVLILKNFFPYLGFKSISIVKRALDKLMHNQNPSRTNFQVLTDSLPGNLETPLWNFYRQDFPRLAFLCTPAEEAKDALLRLKEKGHRLYLTTNPIWPEECVHQRLKWAGLNPSLFDGLTHSQNWHSCKPNLQYYREVMTRWNLNPTDCILIGDSKIKEGPASQLGIEVVILTKKSAFSFWKALGK